MYSLTSLVEKNEFSGDNFKQGKFEIDCITKTGEAQHTHGINQRRTLNSHIKTSALMAFYSLLRSD